MVQVTPRGGERDGRAVWGGRLGIVPARKHTEETYADLGVQPQFLVADLGLQGPNLRAKRRKLIQSLLSIGPVH